MTVIQRRVDNTNFYRTWGNFKTGFGNKSASFWLGLDRIHALTSACSSGSRLLVKATRNDVIKQYDYSGFTVSTEADNYLMNYTKHETGGEDSMINNKGQMFSTFDRDNDRQVDFNAAMVFKSGWWHTTNSESNPNGPISRLYWYAFNMDRVPLDSIEMRIYC